MERLTLTGTTDLRRYGYSAVCCCVLLMAAAACGGPESIQTATGRAGETTSQPTTTATLNALGPSGENATVVVYPDGLDAFGFDSLASLAAQAQVVVQGTVVSHRWGETNKRDGYSITPRLSTVQVDQAMKGKFEGEAVEVFDAAAEQRLLRSDEEPGPSVITSATRGHLLEVGDRVIIALLSKPSIPGAYMLVNSMSYLLLTSDGSAFQPIDVDYEVILAAQRMTPAEVRAELTAD